MLHFASAYGHPSVVELFIKSGAQLDAQTKVHYKQLVGDNITLNVVLYSRKLLKVETFTNFAIL